MTSLSEKLSPSIIESASENENQNSSSSDNETLPDSTIKRKRKRRCVKLLYAEECSKRNHLKAMKENLTLMKLVEIMRQMIQKNFFEIAEEEDIHLQTDSKKKATMFFPLKVVKEIIVIGSDDE